METNEHPADPAETHEDRASPDESGQGNGAHIVYYDASLDQAHNSAGYAEESDDQAEWQQLYDATPTLLQRLWWQSRGVVYLISFAIPLLLLILPVVIWLVARGGGKSSSPSTLSPTSTALPSPTGTVVAAWPSDVAFVPNTVPAMIRDELALAGERRGYQFQGAAGDTWHILVEPEDTSGLDPLITLFGPSGDIVAISDNEDTGQVTAEIRITLPEPGPYRLLVESAQGGLTTGTYLLTLYVE
jgi:hypothetical protein